MEKNHFSHKIGKMKQKKFHSLGKALSGIAHDYNDLLARIEGHARFLEREDGTGTDALHHDNLQAILQAAQDGMVLTRRLLEIGAYPDDTVERCDLVATIRQNRVLLRAMLGSGADIRLELPEHGLYVPYCEEGIVQILIGCALDARARHAGRMVIAVTRHHDALRLVIHDNGIDGAPDAALSEELFTVQEWLRLAGGTITTQADPHNGHAISIILPLGIQHENPFRDRTILVLDDGAGLSASAEIHLTKMGMTVLQAANAESALVLNREHHGRIDLLLANAAIPGLDSVRVVRELVRDNPAMRVVYMTHAPDEPFDEAEMLQEILREEIVFPKPLSMRKLSSTLEKALRAIMETDKPETGG